MLNDAEGPGTVDEVAPTGIAGLDEIVRGGLPREQMYFIQGDPGAGKTTLSFQFLLEGVRRGEKALYVTLSASERDLQRVAHTMKLEAQETDDAGMEARIEAYIRDVIKERDLWKET